MFDNLATRKMAILRQAIAVRQTQGFEPAAAIITNGEGKRVMDAARAVVAQMQTEEDRLWRERVLEQRDQANRVAAISVGALAIASTLLVLATLYVTRG